MTKHIAKSIVGLKDAAPREAGMAAKAQEKMLEIPEKEAIGMLKAGKTTELEKMGKVALPFLERIAGKGDNPKIRKNAIEAIRTIGDKSSIPALAEVMGNEKEISEVRVAAAGAIGDMGDASSIPLFHKVLRTKKVEKKKEKKAEPSEEEVMMGEYVRGMIEMSLKALVERLLDEEKRK